MKKALQILTICLLLSVGLRSETKNFNPSVYNGRLCFAPTNAAKLLDAYNQIEPLKKNFAEQKEKYILKINNLQTVVSNYDAINWLDKKNKRKKLIITAVISGGVGIVASAIGTSVFWLKVGF
jgi:hypothetical protein